MALQRVCVITGSRAEYGLLYWVLHDLRADPGVDPDLVVERDERVHRRFVQVAVEAQDRQPFDGRRGQRVADHP